MASPLLSEMCDGFDIKVCVIIGDVVVTLGVEVPLPHPFTSGPSPMIEMILRNPLGFVGLARVVKSILRSFETMHVKHNLESVFVGHIK